MDLREAIFVMGNGAVLYSDLKRFWSKVGDTCDEDVDLCPAYNCDDGEEDRVADNDNMVLVKGGTAVELAPDAKRLHHSIENAGKHRICMISAHTRIVHQFLKNETSCFQDGSNIKLAFYLVLFEDG